MEDHTFILSDGDLEDLERNRIVQLYNATEYQHGMYVVFCLKLESNKL